MKTQGVREFLRGGYQQADKPILVMNHSRPVGVWMPYGATESPSLTFDTTSTQGSFTVTANIGEKGT